MQLNRLVTSILASACLILSAVVTVVPKVEPESAKPTLDTYAEIVTDNPASIHVLVDTRPLPADYIVRYAVLTIMFFDQYGKRLGEHEYSFVDRKLVAMKPGHWYERWFLNPYPSARSLSGRIEHSGGGVGSHGQTESFEQEIMTSGGMPSPDVFYRIDTEPKAAITISTLDNTTMNGPDLRNFDLDEGDQNTCEQACYRDLNCVTFTYVRPSESQKAQCWLKSAVLDIIEDTCCVSGIKRGPGIPAPPPRIP